MQQQSQPVVQSRRIRPTRLVRYAHHLTTAGDWATARVAPTINAEANNHPVSLDTSNEDIDISLLDTLNLLQLSGMLQALQVEKQRTGAIPRVNVDGHESAGRTLPF